VAVRFQELNAVFDLSGFDIPGEHNLDNAALAAALSLATGADPYRVQSAISGLRPLAHRMEVVSKRGGITWINDSKATNVAATAVGVRGLQGGGVLLLGGQAKGDAFAELVPLLGEWRVITFGGSGEAIADELCQLGVSVERAGNLADAVQRSRTLAQVGDRVLLSPGCASFDEFRNFEHRGQTFRELTEGVNP